MIWVVIWLADTFCSMPNVGEVHSFWIGVPERWSNWKPGYSQKKPAIRISIPAVGSALLSFGAAIRWCPKVLQVNFLMYGISDILFCVTLWQSWKKENCCSIVVPVFQEHPIFALEECKFLRPGGHVITILWEAGCTPFLESTMTITIKPGINIACARVSIFEVDPVNTTTLLITETAIEVSKTQILTTWNHSLSTKFPWSGFPM